LFVEDRKLPCLTMNLPHLNLLLRSRPGSRTSLNVALSCSPPLTSRLSVPSSLSTRSSSPGTSPSLVGIKRKVATGLLCRSLYPLISPGSPLTRPHLSLLGSVYSTSSLDHLEVSWLMFSTVASTNVEVFSQRNVGLHSLASSCHSVY